MRKILTFLAAFAATLSLAQDFSWMKVDSSDVLIVPNKSAFQDANGFAARDRANTWSASNTFSLLPTVPLLPGRLIVGNASSNGAAVAVSGDATLSTNGLVQCTGLTTNVVLVVDGKTNTMAFTRGLLTAFTVTE